MTDRLCALLSGQPDVRPGDADVAALFVLAREHRVHLLLACRLLPELAGTIPEPIRVELRVEAMRDTLRGLELARVVAALEASGCSPLVFKGAALALTHYAQPWLRPRLDTDILIDAASRSRAAAALTALGYVRPPMTSGRFVMHQEMWVRQEAAAGEHVLDLHWRVVNPNVLARLPGPSELRARAARVAVQGTIAAVASPADALVIACVHRAAHHDDSAELLWLYDVQLLARRLSAPEWQHVTRVAQRSGVAGLVWRGLDLASTAFEFTVPAAVRDALTSVSSRHEASLVFVSRNQRPIDRLRADVAALGPIAGARLVSEHLFPPPSYMRERYGLTSGAQLPAAYARRILGGARAWFKAPS
jgi:hypothetical protein